MTGGRLVTEAEFVQEMMVQAALAIIKFWVIVRDDADLKTRGTALVRAAIIGVGREQVLAAVARADQDTGTTTDMSGLL